MTGATIATVDVWPVQTVAGERIELQTETEQKFYLRAQDKYQTENRFTHASDLRSVDRLVFNETMVYRWQIQLASGRNYQGAFLDPREEEQLRKNIKEMAPQISMLQNDLGLTKSQRDKEAHDSVGAYITQLQVAAKEHGIRREKQLGKAIELSMQLFSLVAAYKRSNEAEREKLGFEGPDDILEWITGYMRPEFDAVDAYFRTHQQKNWVRKI